MDENTLKIHIKQADACLEMIRGMNPKECTEEQVYTCLRTCLNLRFGISEKSETNFRRLAIISIKKRNLAEQALPESVIEKRIHQYDCHQTSLITQMKILFVMYVEKKLDICLDDEKVTGSEDLVQFAHVVFQEVTKEG